MAVHYQCTALKLSDTWEAHSIQRIMPQVCIENVYELHFAQEHARWLDDDVTRQFPRLKKVVLGPDAFVLSIRHGQPLCEIFEHVRHRRLMGKYRPWLRRNQKLEVTCEVFFGVAMVLPVADPRWYQHHGATPPKTGPNMFGVVTPSLEYLFKLDCIKGYRTTFNCRNGKLIGCVSDSGVDLLLAERPVVADSRDRSSRAIVRSKLSI